VKFTDGVLHVGWLKFLYCIERHADIIPRRMTGTQPKRLPIAHHAADTKPLRSKQ